MSHYTLDYPKEFKKSAEPYSIPQYLLLCGGPSNASDRVLKTISSQNLNPMCGANFKIMDEVKMMLKHLFQTTNPLTLAIQTSGNGGNEAIILNLLSPGDKILIPIKGIWGDTLVDMASRHGLEIFTVRKEPGEVFTVDELETAITEHRPKLLFLVHGESSVGVVQKLDGIGEMCHKHDCLFAVDGVSSFCVHPLFVDRWEIDAVSAASQKAVGATTGLCMLSFSPKAQERIFAKKRRPPYYFDLKPLAVYWNCCDAPRAYHYTFSSNLLAALREALAQICEEGLVNVWKRHEANAQLLWEKLDDVGLECAVQKRANRFHAITCVKIPPGIDDFAFLNYLKSRHNIDISAGDEPKMGVTMRIGLMGRNSRAEVVECLMDALKDGLNNFGHNKQ